MKKLHTVIFFALCTLRAAAQAFTGTVYYDRPGGNPEPLPFAQVYHLEKERLIDTDASGRFAILLSERATFVATYVGYTRDTLIVEPGVRSGEFHLYGENEVDEATVTARQATLSRLKPVKTEVITSAGLCKMACCALASSFENSSSVTVGYADAVTGARQIKLLGLSGAYTQMLDESRPVLRGLQSPFGLSYIPGQWLESIQISKGPASVSNGVEAITGQINVEHRKPTDETPLFVQLYGGSDAMLETNVASALQLNEKWSTVILAHVGATVADMDHNGDGFRDDPRNLQVNVANRWLYYSPTGVQVRFGMRYVNDDRLGGQMGSGKDNALNLENNVWGTRILNRGVNGYVKVGVPLNDDQSSNVAVVFDYTHHETDSFYGPKTYDGLQNSYFGNLLYSNTINERHSVKAGLTFSSDCFKENLLYPSFPAGNILHHHNEVALSGFGEYTFSYEDKLTFVGGVNLDYNWNHGWLFSPRGSFKYSFTDAIVARLVGGRGFRCSNIFADNPGIFSTNRAIEIAGNLDTMEDAWTFGGNITFYLPFGFDAENTYVSFDYFRNDFNHQVIVDQEYKEGKVCIYNLDGHSYTNTYQVDFNVNPVERFNVVATFRYNDAKVTLAGKGLRERPMSSRFKAVLNLQYATRLSKWIFDFTAQLNGAMRLPDFAAKEWGMETSPVYPTLYAQVTRKFKGVDVYVGGENLTNFTQKNAILGADRPFSSDFNASCVWGPLMGIKVYAGLRYTLWKR